MRACVVFFSLVFPFAIRVLADGVGAHLQRRQENCPNQCGQIDSALTACTDDACFCPTAVAFGPACSQCLATVNITQAQALGTVISGCKSEFPTLATGTISAAPAAPTFGQCTQCAVIDNAVSSCSDDSCLCPTVLQLGPGCSSCLATINATEASILGSAITLCQSEFYPSTAAQPIPSLPTVSTVVSVATTSSSPSHRSAAHSATGELLEMRWIHFILFLLFIAGALM